MDTKGGDEVEEEGAKEKIHRGQRRRIKRLMKGHDDEKAREANTENVNVLSERISLVSFLCVCLSVSCIHHFSLAIAQNLAQLRRFSSP